MNNKILLAVDVENIILENGIYRIFAFSPKQAKSEAEAYIKDKCIALIDEILELYSEQKALYCSPECMEGHFVKQVEALMEKL